MKAGVSIIAPVKCGDSSSNGSRNIQQRSRRIWHFRPFLNFDSYQPEVVSDVISGVVVDPRGVKVFVKFGDSRSNRSRYIRLPHVVANNDNDDAGRRTPGH